MSIWLSNSKRAKKCRIDPDGRRHCGRGLLSPTLSSSEGGEGEDAQGNFFTASDPLQKRLFSKLTGLTRLKGFWLGTGALRGNPKGIGSFSPGLRGTSYPGAGHYRISF